MSLFSSLLDEDVLGRPAREKQSIAKREVFIAIRRDGIAGDGTRRNPYNGSNPANLDIVLNGNLDFGLRTPVRFVFGPGIFRTGGGWKNSDPRTNLWTGARSGQEFVGAGMFATTLRLEVPAPLENASYGVFGVEGQRSDNVLIQDLTIDCDMQNQSPTPPYKYPRIMVLGINLLGDNIRVRRVRVINAGTRTPVFEYDYKAPRGLNVGAECFPIFLTSHGPGSGSPTLDQRNSFIEDCIVERPYHSNGRETTCMHIGGPGYNDHCGIRNCLVDCAIVPQGPFPKVPVQSLVFTATEGTLVTLTQHDLKVGDKVIISGAGAPYDGKHLVTSIPPDPHFPGALHQWKAILAPGPTPGTASGSILAEKLSKPALLCTLSYASGDVTVATHVFNNRQINGDLARVVNTDTGLYVPELTTDAEDVLLSL